MPAPTRINFILYEGLDLAVVKVMGMAIDPVAQSTVLKGTERSSTKAHHEAVAIVNKRCQDVIMFCSNSTTVL